MEETEQLLAECREALFAAREKRPRPHRDDKVLLLAHRVEGGGGSMGDRRVRPEGKRGQQLQAGCVGVEHGEAAVRGGAATGGVPLVKPCLLCNTRLGVWHQPHACGVPCAGGVSLEWHGHRRPGCCLQGAVRSGGPPPGQALPSGRAGPQGLPAGSNQGAVRGRVMVLQQLLLVLQ